MRVFLDTNILLDVLMNRPGLVAESEAATDSLPSGQEICALGERLRRVIDPATK